MTFRSNFKMLALAAMTLAAFATTAHAETWAPTATKATAVASTARTAVTHIAAMQAGTLTHVVVALKLRNKVQLDQLTADLMAGRSHNTLSSADFMRTYAPTKEQVQAVVSHLAKSGFTNITVSANNLLVSANGSAGSVKTAFNTELHTYSVNGRNAYANVSDASVPQALGNIVLAVHGLQTVHLNHTMLKKADVRTAAKILSVTGHNPTDFPTIYNAASLPSASNATIGIIAQGDLSQTIADLNTFTSNSGYPQTNVSTVVVNGASSDTSGIDEWNMDTQSSLAAAGGTIKQMILYAANTLSDADLTSAYNQVVSDNKAQAINVSLGECETDAQSSGVTASNDQIFQSAVAQGQTFSVSSGDSGAYECDTSATAQSYPAVSPYVIAVGGTQVNTGSNNAWSSESVWSCSDWQSCQQSANGGAGGGPSTTESAPSWQVSAGVGSSSSRGVPDISLDADPSSGALVLINGSATQIGGTSLAAPLFTGFWARVQSANNNSLPFPATAIYQKAAANPSMFHDITSGNQGYAAKAGWDYASGYGSLNVANFASVIGSGGTTPPPPPPGNVLTSGVPVTGLGLPAGSSKVYTIVVPAGRTSLTFKTSGGRGDADIYASFGTAPTTSSYQYVSDGSTTSENITIRNPKAGTYYLLLNSYATFSGVTLVAND
ncbi:protease pro-enzyme activation domain-containing protein [Collimonas sp.]|jgi:pseudomonalisin|uniref:protease pro-enzyme activation domain-containing protein n=1 Tax=Collimonas sp. TaxID=1963772 RepID=UPI002CE9AAC4|nr:protease pro-enzyme activation domain-containing protein [Collimonas sp.]HWX01046.1 protease pro-enzyme activation domain-containing protein [Collimonas sp.]